MMAAVLISTNLRLMLSNVRVVFCYSVVSFLPGVTYRLVRVLNELYKQEPIPGQTV